MDKEIVKEGFNKINNIPMVFIMGKERSGSTLLQTLLDGHPNIIAPPESEFIVLLYPRFGKIKKWTEQDIHNFIHELYKEPWMAKIWHIDRKHITLILLSIKDEANYATICKAVYFCMRNGKQDILLISDKNPLYILFISTLLKIFPEAKFIHLVRDPRDNINSHLKSFKVTNLRFLAFKWLAYAKLPEKVKTQMPERFYTLLYESLVETPEGSMKKLCDFLSISFDEKMLHNLFPERVKAYSNQQLLMDRVEQIHSNLLMPINTSNIGKWKKDMSPENSKIIEKITGDFAAKTFHYQINSNPGPIGLVLQIKIVKSRIIYYSWQSFTRIKYKKYWFNRLYTKLNILIGREKEVFGEID